MFTWEWFSGEFAFTLSLLLASLFMCVGKERRSHFALKVAAGSIILVGEVFLARYIGVVLEMVDNLKVWNYAVQYLLVVLIMFLCCNEGFFGALFFATVGYEIQHIATRTMYFVHEYVVTAMPDEVAYALRIVLVFAICALIYLFLRHEKYYSEKLVIGKISQIVLSFVIVIIPIFTFSRAAILADLIGSRELFSYIFWMSLMFSVACLFLELCFVLKSNKSLEIMLLKKLMQVERDRYEREKSDAELVRIKCHDLRHIINGGCLLQDSVRKDIARIVEKYDSVIDTGSEALNVTVNRYAQQCLDKKIQFTCLVDGSKLSAIPPYEIYALFGNALENAVKAVENLPEDKRIISINSATNGNIMNVNIENYFEGQIKFRDGLPESKGGAEHGFGMKSMRYIMKKNGGKFNCFVHGDMFILQLMFIL